MSPSPFSERSVCVVDDCTRTAKCKGMCLPHYGAKFHGVGNSDMRRGRGVLAASPEQVGEIRRLSSRFVSPAAIAKQMGMSQQTIHNILNRKGAYASTFIPLPDDPGPDPDIKRGDLQDRADR